MPASARAVAAASSRRGCRWTRFAASAPAKPDAPATTTRASLTKRPSDPGERSLDRVAPLRDPGIRQGSVGRSELQPQREALSPLPNLLAPVEVEHGGAAKELPAALHHRPPNGCRGNVVGNDDRQVLVDARIGGDVLVRFSAVRRGGNQIGQPDREGGRRFEVPLAADQWVDLAQPARLDAAHDDSRRAPRVQEGLHLGPELDLDSEVARESLERALDREEVGAPGLAPPARRGQRPNRNRTHAPPLAPRGATPPRATRPPHA